MISTFSDLLENTSISDVIQLYWNNILLYLTDFFAFLNSLQSRTILNIAEKLPEWLYFDEFQTSLLQIFLGILFLNLLFIVILWRIYGETICERFMKLSTLREIEELKASVAKLKLPKEHTPRI
ncbi:unnamed protein product [Callosobruchus maculatus]|uniref:Uncharacterized protein n=1 Tax=Callosobruchus maculatus TaxID=64391 RepID=A0A653BZM3_CALMS|nr:unnamed protein product [Callosobruchus maculatus]